MLQFPPFWKFDIIAGLHQIGLAANLLGISTKYDAAPPIEGKLNISKAKRNWARLQLYFRFYVTCSYNKLKSRAALRVALRYLQAEKANPQSSTFSLCRHESQR
jgi:hypothetical protein